MQEIKMLTIPVSPEFYKLFRLKAAEKNKTIAAYGRVLLERAVCEPEKPEEVHHAKATSHS